MMRASNLFRMSGGIVVAGAIVAVAVWPDVTSVDVAAVTRGPMQVTVDEEGETRVRDRFIVSAPVSGRLLRVALEPGDAVRCHDVVLKIAPADAPLLDARSLVEFQTAANAAAEAVAVTRAERDRAAAALDRAVAAERRLTNLVAIGAVSREDFETAQTARVAAASALTAAEHAVARADAEWQAAKARVSRPGTRTAVIDIPAPVSGVVLKRLRESESVVAAGEPLMEIGDPRQIEIVADLLSADAVRVHAGDPVSIDRWGGSITLRGTIRRVEPSGFLKVSALGVEEQRVNVIITLDDPLAASDLGDGYRVDVRIAVWRSDAALTVPIGALFRNGRDWAVFVLIDGRAVMRMVEVGERNNDVAQILKGLDAGDRVVLHPPDTIGDAARVRPRQ
jgi:HlyD family secretion protein